MAKGKSVVRNFKARPQLRPDLLALKRGDEVPPVYRTFRPELRSLSPRLMVERDPTIKREPVNYREDDRDHQLSYLLAVNRRTQSPRELQREKSRQAAQKDVFKSPDYRLGAQDFKAGRRSPSRAVTERGVWQLGWKAAEAAARWREDD